MTPAVAGTQRVRAGHRGAQNTNRSKKKNRAGRSMPGRGNLDRASTQHPARRHRLSDHRRESPSVWS